MSSGVCKPDVAGRIGRPVVSFEIGRPVVGRMGRPVVDVVFVGISLTFSEMSGLRIAVIPDNDAFFRRFLRTGGG